MNIDSIRIQEVNSMNMDEFNSLRELLGVSLKTQKQFQNEGWRSWLIQRHEKEIQTIGMINIVPVKNGESEIGFALLLDERGKGILSQILGPFVKMMAKPLYSETSEDNESAKRVLEKAGFSRCKAVHEVHLDPTGREVVTAAFKFTPRDK